MEDDLTSDSMINNQSPEFNRKMMFKDLRIKLIERSSSFQFTMISLDQKIQDLTQENEEAKLLNLQYQCTNQSLLEKQEELKEENDKLAKQINLEKSSKGIKRKSESSDDSTPKRTESSSPDTSTSNDKSQSKPKSNDELVKEINNLRTANSRLLIKKMEVDNHYTKCWNCYKEIKAKLEQLKDKSSSEIAKDPRLLSVVNKQVEDAEKEKKRLQEEIIKLHKEIKQFKQIHEVDLNKVKKEVILDDGVPRVNDDNAKKSQKILEEVLKKKEKEIEKKDNDLKEKDKELSEAKNLNDKYFSYLNKSKEAFVQLQKEYEDSKIENETQKKMNVELQEKIGTCTNKLNHLEKEKKEEKEQLEQQNLSIIKDLEERHGLEIEKIRNDNELLISKLKDDHLNQLESQKELLEKAKDLEKNSIDIDKLRQSHSKLEQDLRFNIEELGRYKSLNQKYHEQMQSYMTSVTSLQKELEEQNNYKKILDENRRLFSDRCKNLELQLKQAQDKNQIYALYLANNQSSQNMIINKQPIGMVNLHQNTQNQSGNASPLNQMNAHPNSMINQYNQIPNGLFFHQANGSTIHHITSSNDLPPSYIQHNYQKLSTPTVIPLRTNSNQINQTQNSNDKKPIATDNAK